MILIAVLISLVIWGLFFDLCWWGLREIGLSEPWNKLARVVLIIAILIVAIGVITGGIAPFYFLTETLK